MAPSPLTIPEENPVLQKTLSAVNWDHLLTIARDIHKAKSATWTNQQHEGGFNVVRFIRLSFENGGRDRDQDIEIVARVPYQPLSDHVDDDEWATVQGNRIASEVASMEYVALHTSIPVPRVIKYDTERDGGGVGSPYILMTKGEGQMLSGVWDDMDDEKREHIIGQVVDILLQFYALRFDSIGVLMRRESEGDSKSQSDNWYIAPKSTIYSSSDNSIEFKMRQVFKSGSDYWTTYANARLEKCDKEHFGGINKSYEYAMLWFLRSLIPTLIDPSLDAEGFPLFHGDFHSQNILVTDLDTPSPRITTLIDWEFTSTDCTSSVSQFPFFIIDHPFWSADHPLRKRNPKDQKTFVRLLREREGGGKTSTPPLSRVYERCLGIYLFEQCISNEIMFNTLYDELFAHVFGEQDEDEPFSVEYYFALHKGLLGKMREKLEKEVLVRKEAVAVLGEELITKDLSREEFKRIVEENLENFASGEQVRQWLADLYTGSYE